MKISGIVALSFGLVTIGASLPALAESTRPSQESPKLIKIEALNRQRTNESKPQKCNIQCITTPCPCTDKPTDRDRKFDRQK